MTTLTLARVHRARLSTAHSAYLSAAIERYRMKAVRALKLAQTAARHGNRSLAAGLIDEASAYRAMANGLEEQSRLDQVARPQALDHVTNQLDEAAHQLARFRQEANKQH